METVNGRPSVAVLASVSAPALDHSQCYAAVQSRDARFDGIFFTAVRTTGIYCRPSCPTPTLPKSSNVEFHRTSASAQHAGFRSCKRCRPDASPGSPEWDLRGDLVGRALRLIHDGVVDREGVAGIANSLHVSERHLNRVLQQAVGAGPLALARAQRAQTARILIETTDLKFADVAFASGFGSIRQFNDTINEVFVTSPKELRAKGQRTGTGPASGSIQVRLPYRAPLDFDALLRFLDGRAIEGVERVDVATQSYTRSLRLPNGHGVAAIRPGNGFLYASFHLESLADLAAATTRIRRLFDLDADPVSITEHIGKDPALTNAAQRYTGLRVPGTVDPHEVAFRAVIGQQVSVSGARTVTGRIAAGRATPLTPSCPNDEVKILFPSCFEFAELDEADLPMPTARARTVIELARRLASNDIQLHTGVDRTETARALEAVPGIGPWTSGYIALRGLGDPDVCLSSDLVALQGARRLGISDTAAQLAEYARRWAPWRSYATHLLWASASAGNQKSGNQQSEKAQRELSS